MKRGLLLVALVVWLLLWAAVIVAVVQRDHESLGGASAPAEGCTLPFELPCELAS